MIGPRFALRAEYRDLAEVKLLDVLPYVSVPTRLLDAVGEDTVRAALQDIPVYDLYAGVRSKD